MGKRTKDNTITVRGRIDAVFYAGPRFSAGRLETQSGDEIQFAGRFYAREQDHVVLHGRWITHSKYGRQFEVDTMEYDLELDTDGLANYLANHPDIKGIGPAKARLIAQRFGRDFDRAISEEPEAVAQAAGLRIEAIHRLRTEWRKTRQTKKAITWLAAYGLTHYQVTFLVKKFGNDVLGLLKADPYIFVREVRGFGFKRVDKIARIAIEYAKKDRRIRVAACEHRGAVKSLKAAVADTFGAFLCWVDSDDLLSPTALEETVAVLDEHPSVGMVYTDYQLIDAAGRIKGRGRRCRIPYSKDRLLLDFMTFHFRLMRRSVLEQVGGINEDFRCAEDYDLCLRMSEITEVRHIRKPLYFYRVHPESISQRNRIEQIHCSRDAIAQALERRGLADRFKIDLQIHGRFSLKRRKADG